VQPSEGYLDKYLKKKGRAMRGPSPIPVSPQRSWRSLDDTGGSDLQAPSAAFISAHAVAVAGAKALPSN
jgi:hypothetical protein